MKPEKRGFSISGSFRRWSVFNLVGFLGIGVQLVVLALLKSRLDMHYLAATALAVEAAILHNFFWHHRWTWADRTRERGVLDRLLRFNTATATTSVAGNLLLMALLVGYFGLHYLTANLISIASLSYDLRNRNRQVIPYLTGGAGILNHHGGQRWRAGLTFGGGLGVKIRISKDFFFAPEIQLGWEPFLQISGAGSRAF